MNMTWKGNILFILLWGCYDLSRVYGTSSDNFQRKSRQLHHQHELVKDNNDIIQDEQRILSDMMRPGDRVSAMDRESAICSANLNTDREIATEQTVIDYYYAIESSEVISTNDSTGRSMIRELEDKLFRAISPAVLWCYYDYDNEFPSPPTRRLLSQNSQTPNNGDSLSLQAGGFERDGLRRLTLEEARRLSIVSFSTSPEDEQTTIGCKFPTSSDHCIVMHGMITIMHHVTSDVSLAVASVYDSTQKTMDSNELFTFVKKDKDFFHITNIKWLGETEQEAINGGIVVITGGEKSISAIVVGIESGEDTKSMPVAYAVLIPLLVLLALILLFAGQRTRQKARLQEQLLALESFDNENLVGTGDPPGSFHEGMYHYTRNGARYLSTNCAECIETRKNGFLNGFDEIHFGERDQSNRRKRNLVRASSGALGMKHSSIDVHNCSSGACKICAHRPRDVQFVPNPEGSFRPFPFENDETSILFGESEV